MGGIPALDRFAGPAIGLARNAGRAATARVLRLDVKRAEALLLFFHGGYGDFRGPARRYGGGDVSGSLVGQSMDSKLLTGYGQFMTVAPDQRCNSSMPAAFGVAATPVIMSIITRFGSG